MGWSYLQSCKSREDFVLRIQPQRDHGSFTLEVLAQADHRTHIWMVIERTEKATGNKRRYIKVMLLADDGWGFKDISEVSFPYVADCPLEYLDMVEMPEEQDAALWRTQVRHYHARRASIAELKVGDRVAIAGCDVASLKLTSLMPMLGVADDGSELIVDPTVLQCSETTGRVVLL